MWLLLFSPKENVRLADRLSQLEILLASAVAQRDVFHFAMIEFQLLRSSQALQVEMDTVRSKLSEVKATHEESKVHIGTAPYVIYTLLWLSRSLVSNTMLLPFIREDSNPKMLL